ncbi:putative ribonuclease H-like domain-containing protein [Tanacetum coccineum]
MTGNTSYLSNYEEIDGGFVAFGGDPKGDTECVVLSPNFKLLDENHVLLRVPRKDNMYSVDLKNIVPSGGLTCLFAKATLDESNLWHRRLGHINFKTMNKLVRGNLVRGIENLIDLKVKVIRCDNGTEFKNKVMNQVCEMKGIKREFSVAKTPQQNRAKAVNTACYVQNRVLVIKPHNKTPYELFLGRKPVLRFMRLFGCLVTILNTIDHLGKFDGKANEGFLIGYSTNSKAFRVFNSRTRIVEETLHITFLENKSNVLGSGPEWLFDIDTLIKSMNYEPVVVRNQSNGVAATKACENTGKAKVETVPSKNYILLPFLTQDPPFSYSLKDSPNARFKPSGEEEKKHVEHLENKDSEVLNTEEPRVNQEQDESVNSTNNINTVSSTVNTASIEDNDVDENTVYGCADDPNMPNLEEIVYSEDDEGVSVEADINNLDTFMLVSPILTTRIHKDHPFEQIIRDLQSAPQTKRMTKSVTEHEAIQEELLQFKLQHVWTLVDLSYGKRAIGTKWVYRNKKDKRGIVIRNKTRLVAQGYTQEEGIDYDEMDVKSAFYMAILKRSLLSCQPPGFQRGQIDKTLFIKRVKCDILLVQVYVDDIIFGYNKKVLCTEFEKLMHKKFPMSFMGELTFFLGLQVTQKDDGIFISQDKFQVTPKVSHLYAVKRIFKYLKGQPKLGLWYPKDSPFDLEAYTDSDYAGVLRYHIRGAEAQIRFEAASKQSNDPPLSRVNTLGSREDNMKLKELMEFCTKQYALTVNPTIYTTCIEQFWATAKVKTVNEECQIQALVDKKKVIITETSIRSDLKLEGAEGTDCLPTATIFAELERMGRKQSKDSGPTKPIPDEATNEEHISSPSYDPPQSGEDRLQLTELMSLCTRLQEKVLDLEKAKTAQAKEIASLKKREDASKQGRKITDLDADAKVTLIDENQERNDEEILFDVQDDLQDEEVVAKKEVAEKEVSAADPVTTAGEVVTTANVEVTAASAPTITINELTLAQTLIEIKAAKPKAVTTDATTTTTTRLKARGVVVQEPSEFKTTSSPSQASQLPHAKDKGKAIMVELEKPLKKKDQIALDEEVARNLEAQLQAELEEEERLARQKEEEATIALI